MRDKLRRLIRFLMEGGGPYYTGVSTKPYDTAE